MGVSGSGWEVDACNERGTRGGVMEQDVRVGVSTNKLWTRGSMQEQTAGRRGLLKFHNGVQEYWDTFDPVYVLHYLALVCGVVKTKLTAL